MKRMRVLCVGAGHMGRSHALACQKLDAFEVVGLCTRRKESSQGLLDELGPGVTHYSDYFLALQELKPDAVCIASYTESHYPFTKAALEAGCHVFVEKPLAETLEQSLELVDLAKTKKLKLLAGYILRHHPAWTKFVELARDLGKPLVMRLNLNQQSSGSNWMTHKNLLASVSPVVDCGVHYVDIMCQMTQSKPIRVSGIGARLTDEIGADKINYGQLQVTFEDGSVGWYEAGWGPMISETAFFVKDVIGPKGSVSIRAEKAASEGKSSNVDSHTQTEAFLVHHAELTKEGTFAKSDEVMRVDEDPDHDDLCLREQRYFAKAIVEDLDLSTHLTDVVNSMRIVFAADESFRTGKMVELS
ncbi:Gfo/Idh/MocA family protein [Lacunimicrobium album]